MGLMADVTSHPPGQAWFRNDTFPDQAQPDNLDSVRISDYSSWIIANDPETVAAAPEPGTLCLLAAGLALLLEADPDRLAKPEAAQLLAAHHRPNPRLAAGLALASMGLRCAIDISDGVASEAWHVARSSGVEIALDTDRLPLHLGAVALFGREKARQLAVAGGEDYELLFAVPEARLAEVEAALAEQGGATVVGRVVGQRAGGRVELLHAGRVVEPGQPGYVAF
jgi:thiamine-monophosphate kinase